MILYGTNWNQHKEELGGGWDASLCQHMQPKLACTKPVTIFKILSPNLLVPKRMVKRPHPRKEIYLYKSSIKLSREIINCSLLCWWRKNASKKWASPLKFLVQVKHFSKSFPVYHIFTLSFELQLQWHQDVNIVIWLKNVKTLDN